MTIVPRVQTLLRPRSEEDVTRVKAVRLWGSQIEGRDFTKSKWDLVEATRARGDWRAALPEPTRKDSGRAAFIGEVEVEDSRGRSFTVHTPVQVWELGPTQ